MADFGCFSGGGEWPTLVAPVEASSWPTLLAPLAAARGERPTLGEVGAGPETRATAADRCGRREPSESYSCSACFLLSQVPSERAVRHAPHASPSPSSTPEPAAHLAAAAIILASPGPFHSVRALHRKLQRRVRSSSQLMYVVEGLVRDGLASLVQVVVRPARRSKAVFYKALPPPADDDAAATAFAGRLADYGISADMYVDQLGRRDPQMDVFTHAALLREHPEPRRLAHFYRQHDRTKGESEGAPGQEADRQHELGDSVSAEREREVLPDFDHPQLFHNFEPRTESETAPDSVHVASDVLLTQSGAESYSELHHLERLCASGTAGRAETESESFRGDARQVDNNGLSVPQS